MSEEVKKGRGRPSRWGKGDADKKSIAKDLANLETVSFYYIQKLIEKGLLEVKLTEKGEQFLAENE